jgi:membrane protease YdiL (CAAX protease family)
LIGLPSATITAILALNMLLVGLSEELMFRSIMFRGLLARFRVWPAILLTSLLFGLVHSLNVFTTGQMEQAVLQSAAAFMQGLAYLAIRIRTRSVWPMVIVHALWDFSLMLSTTTHASGTDAGWSWTPLLIALPIFLYGLFLLRHVGKNDLPEYGTDVAGETPRQART